MVPYIAGARERVTLEFVLDRQVPLLHIRSRQVGIDQFRGRGRAEVGQLLRKSLRLIEGWYTDRRLVGQSRRQIRQADGRRQSRIVGGGVVAGQDRVVVDVVDAVAGTDGGLAVPPGIPGNAQVRRERV